jgi:hypothetical protein
VSAGHAGNPDFVRGAAAKFILHGYDGHILAPSSVLDGSNTRDEMRGKVLVKVNPHAARRRSNAQASSTCLGSIRTSCARSSTFSAPNEAGQRRLGRDVSAADDWPPERMMRVDHYVAFWSVGVKS